MLFVENINIVYVLSIQGFDVIVNALLGNSQIQRETRKAAVRGYTSLTSRKCKREGYFTDNKTITMIIV